TRSTKFSGCFTVLKEGSDRAFVDQNSRSCLNALVVVEVESVRVWECGVVNYCNMFRPDLTPNHVWFQIGFSGLCSFAPEDSVSLLRVAARLVAYDPSHLGPQNHVHLTLWRSNPFPEKPSKHPGIVSRDFFRSPILNNLPA